MSEADGPVVRCAGAVVFDDQGCLLLVRRGHEPAMGRWCEPGGRCEPGESAEDACVREAREETGLDVEVVRHLGTARDGRYVIDCFLCRVVGGRLQAGDDAGEARWVGPEEFAALPLVDDLTANYAAWGCLPGPRD